MEQDNAIAPITSLKIGNSYLSKTFPGKLYEPPLKQPSSGLTLSTATGFVNSRVSHVVGMDGLKSEPKGHCSDTFFTAK